MEFISPEIHSKMKKNFEKSEKWNSWGDIENGILMGTCKRDLNFFILCEKQGNGGMGKVTVAKQLLRFVDPLTSSNSSEL